MPDDLNRDLSRRDTAGISLTVVGALLLSVAISALLLLWAFKELNSGRLLAVLGCFALAAFVTAAGISVSLKAKKERTAHGLDEPVDHEARRKRAEQGVRRMKTVMALEPVSIALWILLAYVIEYWDWRVAIVIGFAHAMSIVSALLLWGMYVKVLRGYEPS